MGLGWLQLVGWSLAVGILGFINGWVFGYDSGYTKASRITAPPPSTPEDPEWFEMEDGHGHGYNSGYGLSNRRGYGYGEGIGCYGLALGRGSGYGYGGYGHGDIGGDGYGDGIGWR